MKFFSGSAAGLRPDKPELGTWMLSAAARWRPFRSLAAWYMWRVVEDKRGK